MYIIETEVNPDFLNTLYGMFNCITIPKRCSTSPRYNTVGMRTICFGDVKYKIQYKDRPISGISRFTKLYPEIYDELKLIIKNIFPDFKYTTIQVNHNVVMGYHTDKNNSNDTVILSFGEYQNGELVIDEVKYNMNCKAVRFNSSKIRHKTLPLIGNKYSLVYFSNH